ncbi:uncharacterized protein LOC122063955 [Macadamia integrifolia]|uniref:uncharacterized protein LOC122063955 n=1 Tax=Macadamia integrifolia TaxID=60698 RepID=UPI001C4F448B|nr:uncharacterized protein LOC122063955 [Macadamia integrifolia]
MENEQVNGVYNLLIQEQVCDGVKEIDCGMSSLVVSENHGFCAICLEKIALEETALVKDCEHAYCVTCILRWATYNQKPFCPQCKCPFEFLNVHRALDGRIHDYMFEESVCLLLRATWFVPLKVEAQKEVYDELEDIYQYLEEDDDENDDEDLEAAYYTSTNLRIGNRRWGDNGYVRAGRKEARPVHREFQDHDAGPSRGPKKKEVLVNDSTGRRAKRALKREAADKAAAAKHQQHLVRLGRK